MGTDALTKAARRAMERMYIDTCKISVNVKTVDEKTHVTRQKWTVLAEDEPCRLSFLSFPANGESDTADVMMQSVVLSDHFVELLAHFTNTVVLLVLSVRAWGLEP